MQISMKPSTGLRQQSHVFNLVPSESLSFFKSVSVIMKDHGWSRAILITEEQPMYLNVD